MRTFKQFIEAKKKLPITPEESAQRARRRGDAYNSALETDNEEDVSKLWNDLDKEIEKDREDFMQRNRNSREDEDS